MCWLPRTWGRRERETWSKPIKDSCPGVVRGCFEEESGAYCETLVLKSVCKNPDAPCRWSWCYSRGRSTQECILTFLVKLAGVPLGLCSALPLPSTKSMQVEMLPFWLGLTLCLSDGSRNQRQCRISSIRQHWQKWEIRRSQLIAGGVSGGELV